MTPNKPGPKPETEDGLPEPEGPLNQDQAAVRRALRARWECNQTRMAEDLSTPGLPWSRQAVGEWVRGTRSPRFEYLDALARFLGTTVAYLRQPAPGAICVNGRWILPEDHRYDRYRRALELVDPELEIAFGEPPKP